MIHVLKNNALFKGLNTQELDQLIACQKPRIKTYQAKEIVFHKGSLLSEIGIVITGCVLLYKDDYLGNESIIQTMMDGDSFGEAVALNPNEKTMVYAVTNVTTTIAFFNMNHFVSPCKKFCAYHQKTQQNLMRVLSRKLILLQKKLDVLSKRSIRDRLLQYLNQLDKDSDHWVTIHLNRQELANYLNVDRSALSREMGHLIQEKILEIDEKKFRIINSNEYK